MEQRTENMTLEQQAVETSLLASEARFRSLFETMQEGFALHEVICNDDGEVIDYRYLDINPAFERLTGLQRETTVGRTVREVIPYIEDHWITTFGRVALSGEPDEIENYVEEFGRYYHARAYSPERGKFAVVFTDITELKNVQKAIIASEERFRNIMALSPDIISIISETGSLLYNSPAAVSIHGYSQEEMQGLNTFDLIHPDDRAGVDSAFHDLLSGNKQLVTVQYRYRNKDGSYVWMESSGSNQLSNPHIRGVIAISRSIEDRKKAEEERHNLEQQLLRAQKLESLGVLAGGIAHDFNNILTAIIGNISYVRSGLEYSHDGYEPLTRAEKAAKRAAGLARQLLVFAKGGEPVKKFVSLRQIVDDAVSLVLSGSNVEAEISLPPDLLIVNADEGQLSQVFHNIIINAVQAMPDGGRLSVSGSNISLIAGNSLGLAGGDYIELSFHDEGCGIAEEDLARIFDPYFTRKRSGESGMGLAATYSIIKKHNGQIAVSSPPGCGTTFTIVLPGFGSPTIMEVPKGHASGTADKGHSILVMDDDDMVRDLAAITLKRLGYKVDCCVNGTEAVSRYRTAWDEGVPYSLVIMDLTIPGGMGGIEAAEKILSLDPAARLIVSSGYSDDPVMANFSDYGFCAALEKPYNVEEVASILEKKS